jgi:hypothetical protein
VAHQADGFAGAEGGGEEAAGVGVDGQVLHGAVAAGRVDRVVVVEVDLGEVDGLGELGGGGDDGAQVRGGLGVAVGLVGEARGVDRRDDAAGGGHGDLVPGVLERLERDHGLLGPIAGGVRGAVVERPLVGPGHDEQDLRHVKFLLVVVVALAIR